ncbi:hypothetical protein BDF19DRAFT_42005 [Syncephalis fuscata]|nr:hypothetical protein BDF19DRAFT_42005 [Syncephalis fuscata]
MFKINHVAIYRSIKLTPAPCVQATPEELVQRRTIINNQLHSIASQLAKLKLKIDADTRLFLQLSMSVPIRRKVRDRAITTGRVLSTRLSQEYIEQQRLICYQEMLKFELQSMLIKR